MHRARNISARVCVCNIENKLIGRSFTMKNIIRSVLCILLCVLMLCAVVGCAVSSNSIDLMEGIDGMETETATVTEDENAAMTEFAVDLLRESYADGENTLVSPLSVISALGMTANGAVGETKSQMERVFGMDVASLNKYLSAYRKALPMSEKYKLSLANAIWFRDDERFDVKEDFLLANASYYGAGAYRAPFDASTVRDINGFVKENTDGMIKDIINEIPDSAVMYLVNALAFEAEWQAIYFENQVRDGVFTTETGEERRVKMMYSTEGLYLEDGNATGFIKPYAGGKYAFAALLPNEDVSVGEYISTLSGEGVASMLTEAKYATVRAAMPKFEFEYDILMNDALKSLGMTAAFDADAADFSGIGTSSYGPLHIGRVIHKTYISVGERGTRAGAATVVEMSDGTALPMDIKTVHLDRPFVFMIIDCEHNVPIFIGTLADVKS